MWYAYVLKSSTEDWRYIGSTNNLKERFKSHNKKENKSTKHYAPFESEAYVAVQNEQKAKRLEKYFKTGFGKAIFKETNLTVNGALA